VSNVLTAGAFLFGTLLPPRLSDRALLSNDQLPHVRLRNGRLTITPLHTTVPPEAEELGRCAYELLRWVRITDLLVEVDEMTGMSQHFTHLQTSEPVTDPRALYTVLLAEATNLGRLAALECLLHRGGNQPE